MTATGVLDAFEGISDLDPFVLLDAAIGRIAALDPAASNDEALALALDVVRLRRRMDRLDATVADWTLAAHRREGCTVDGYKSTASWLGWKTGVFAGQVRRYLLCSHHHHFLHRQPGWTITVDDQVVRVFRPDGRELSGNPWLN